MHVLTCSYRRKVSWSAALPFSLAFPSRRSWRLNVQSVGQATSGRFAHASL